MKNSSTGFARSVDALDQSDLTATELVRRIAEVYLKPQWKILVVSLTSMVFLAATTGALPFLMRQVADRIFVAKDASMLYVLPGLVVGIMGLRAVADYIGRVSQARISNEVVGGLRQHMFGSLLRADLNFLETMHSGRFVAAFMADVGIVNNAAAGTLTALVKSGLTAFFLVLAMFWMDWILALLVVMGAPGAIYFMSKQRKKIRKSTKGMLKETGDLAAILSQALRSIRIVKAFGQEGLEETRFSASVRRIISQLMKQARASSAMGPATEALTGVGFALAIFYGGWQGIQGNVTMGSFMGFMTAAMLAYQPLKALAGLQGKLTQGTEAAKRVFALIDHVPTVDENADSKPLIVSDGEIKFENVSFSYNEDVPVVRNFNFTIPAGKRVALVGASGSGKTTIINLLMRFFDPDEGRILIDGQDLNTAKLSTVRSATALLTQDPILFDDTIFENIRYGSPDKTDEEIRMAAGAAAAHEFINELPYKYETQVGEAGDMLSGGQRQRVAIARAMLKGAPILLLDEPTSALDSKSESKVQDALESLFDGRTVLMIAHRLSTVQNADIICVLDNGQLVETGSHEELLAKGGLYSDFCKVQTMGSFNTLAHNAAVQ